MEFSQEFFPTRVFSRKGEHDYAEHGAGCEAEDYERGDQRRPGRDCIEQVRDN
jgi:hypothetical protein